MRGGKAYRNALLLGSDWLPEFRFVEGGRESAEKAIREGDNCIITAMMARARKLKLGDELKLDCGRGLKIALKIVGIVDLNWHMVTSRGLLRGLDRGHFDQRTDGPLLVAPWPVKRYTHLWLDYVPEAPHPPDLAFANNTVRVHLRDEIADGTFAHGDELVGAMARIPFVFLLVISLGFVAMLVASADARKHEFAVLRAVGATKGQLAAVLVKEALKVSVIGIVLGLAGGALAGWLFTAGTRAAMANWGIPPSFAVPYLTIAKGAVGAVVFALLVAVPTAFGIISKNEGVA